MGPFQITLLLILISLIRQQHTVTMANPTSPASSSTLLQVQPLNSNDQRIKIKTINGKAVEEIVPKERVCIIGSGNWASAISIIIGNNCQRLPFCHSTVNMYVYEEHVMLENGETEKLSKVINNKHENVKYLKGIQLPTNVKAVPNVIDSIQGATLLIFCLPHQFLKPILHQIRDHYDSLHPSGCRGVSLIKGMDFDLESKSPILISKLIEDTLNERGDDSNGTSDPLNKFSCGVLMGANVANGVARKQICESTLATDYSSDLFNQRTRAIFHTQDHFRIEHTKDIYGAEACGALKNVVALGCGFVDSLYMEVSNNNGAIKEALDDGSNTKAALIRIGLLEMKRFCKMFLNGVKDETFWQSCGIADLITTCYSGRNYKCSKVFGYEQRRQQHGLAYTSTKSTSVSIWDTTKCKSEWARIESSLLNGQKLQGTLTCQEVYLILSSRNLLRYFPLMKVIYEIAFEGKSVDRIVDGVVFVDYDGDGKQFDQVHHRSRL